MSSCFYCKLLCAMALSTILAGTGRAAETISGQITNTGMAALSGIDLDIFDTAGNSVAVSGDLTDAGGLYTITLPGPGNHILRADASLSDGYADQYYNQVFLRSQAQVISVSAGQAVTGINFVLSAGVQISGFVRSAVGNTPLAGIDMDIFTSGGESLGGYPAVTGADGSYTFGALPPGTYIVRADPDLALGQFYVRTYYGGQLRIADATPIMVGGSNVANLNIQLQGGGAISGSVTNLGSGLGISGVDIDVFDALGQRMEVNTSTDPAGNYAIGCVPAGNYVLRADPGLALGYPLTYYPSAYHKEDAQLIAVTAGNTVPNISFALGQGGTISGNVYDAGSSLPLEGFPLDVLDATGRRMDIITRTDPSGNYIAGALPPGDYKLRVDPSVAQGYPRTYYPNTANEADAQWISVISGGAVTSRDFGLTPGGSIAGLVTSGLNGQPIADLDIDVFDSLGVRVEITTRTEADGTYVFGPVPAGNYYLRVDPTVAQGYPMTYYPSEYREVDAQVFAVTAGAQTGGIDFVLYPGGTIRGTITAAGGGAPLAGVDLDCYNAQGTRIEASAISDATGVFVLGPLVAGTYFVGADPALASGYAPQFYLGKPDISLATSISVVAGQESTGIDFSLALAGSISGLVTNSLAQPISGMDLDIFDALTGVRLRQGATTALDGTYSLPQLTAGQYFLRCDPAPGQNYGLQYYSGKLVLATADPITVTAGLGTANINFSLADGGGISGQITANPSGDPIPGMDIDVFQAGTLIMMDQDATTDVNGNYSLDGLPAGTYLVRADPSAPQFFGYDETYYGQVALIEAATPVVVGSGVMVPNIDIVMTEPSLPVARRSAISCVAGVILYAGLRILRRRRAQAV